MDHIHTLEKISITQLKMLVQSITIALNNWGLQNKYTYRISNLFHKFHVNLLFFSLLFSILFVSFYYYNNSYQSLLSDVRYISIYYTVLNILYHFW